MKFASLFHAHLKQSLRAPWAFFFIILAVVIALAAGLRANEQPADRFLVAVVNQDEGTYGSRLIDGLAAYSQLDLRPMGEADAMALLRQDRLEAVFVIHGNYTASLRNNEYRGLIDWYTAPSSRAASTISEPLINGTMRLWIEEQSIRATREYLLVQGFDYAAGDELSQRQIIQQVWNNKTNINLETAVLSRSGQTDPEQDRPAGRTALLVPDIALAACIRWYAVFCVFYLVVSASWVLDINKRGLRIRAIQNGAHLWQILLGTSLAPLLIGLAGYLLAGSLCCLLAGSSWASMAMLTLPMIVYLWTILGLTITLASFLRQTIALLFLAPLVTLINAILGGLIAPLPAWANLLAILSQGLPSRWLTTALSQPLAALPAALLCCLAWFLAGIAVSEFRRLAALRNAG